MNARPDPRCFQYEEMARAYWALKDGFYRSKSGVVPAITKYPYTWRSRIVNFVNELMMRSLRWELAVRNNVNRPLALWIATFHKRKLVGEITHKHVPLVDETETPNVAIERPSERAKPACEGPPRMACWAAFGRGMYIRSFPLYGASLCFRGYAPKARALRSCCDKATRFGIFNELA